MAELRLWMQAWSGQGGRILVRAEEVDKVDGSTLTVDCTEADFRTFETALSQILRRTTTNEPLKYWRRARVRSQTSDGGMSGSSCSAVQGVRREACKSAESERQQQIGTAGAERQQQQAAARTTEEAGTVLTVS